MNIIREQIKLLPYTKELCHEFFRTYVSDPLMTYDEYIYNSEKVDRYYEVKTGDENRRIFAIVVDNKPIGEIQIKNIDKAASTGTLSIILSNDNVKNKGYGTEAIKLALDYAKNELKLKKMLADAVLRNSRSKHVLEKIGFSYIKDDDILSYYEYDL